MRIEEKIRPVVIDTEAILAIGMLASLPPIQFDLILATLSREIAIRVGKIRFPEVIRLAVNTRGARMGVSIRGLTDDSPPERRQRTRKSTTTEKYTRTGLPPIDAGR